MSELLLFSNGHGSGLVSGQPPAKGASELASQIEGLVAGFLELLSQLLFLSLIVDGQNNGNGLSHVFTAKDVRKREGAKQIKRTYILASLAGVPPVTWATLNWANSFL